MSSPIWKRARSSRLGLTSSASMLRDTSRATTTSTPLRLAISRVVPNCGCTSARHRKPMPARNNTDLVRCRGALTLRANRDSVALRANRCSSRRRDTCT